MIATRQDFAGELKSTPDHLRPALLAVHTIEHWTKHEPWFPIVGRLCWSADQFRWAASTSFGKEADAKTIVLENKEFSTTFDFLLDSAKVKLKNPATDLISFLSTDLVQLVRAVNMTAGRCGSWRKIRCMWDSCAQRVIVAM